MLLYAQVSQHLHHAHSPLSFLSGTIRHLVIVCGSALCVEIWPSGHVQAHFITTGRRRCHPAWEAVFMAAGILVLFVHTSLPRPGQEQGVPAVLQRDGESGTAATPCAQCRYICYNVLNVYRDVVSTRWQ